MPYPVILSMGLHHGNSLSILSRRVELPIAPTKGLWITGLTAAGEGDGMMVTNVACDIRSGEVTVILDEEFAEDETLADALARYGSEWASGGTVFYSSPPV